MPEARFLRRPDFARENVLPDPVESAGHQIVHEVVAEGDLVEDLIDPRLLFFERDAGKTEMCLLCHDLMQAGTASALAGAPWRPSREMATRLTGGLRSTARVAQNKE